MAEPIYTVGAVAQALGAPAEGDLTLEICSVAEPAAAGPDQLALAISPEFSEGLSAGAARAAVLWQGADWRALGLHAAIFAPKSRYVMAGLSRVFAGEPHLPAGIHPTAVVEPGADVGEGARIGPFTYIATGARIGANARILNHVSIGAGAQIGVDALIHPHVSIGAGVRIGARFIAQPGAQIGGDGFSFVSPGRDPVQAAKETGQIDAAARTPGFARIHSLGAVTIGDDVEVGANATIDRGTVADTRIGDGTKIDDLVDIGHNVQVGRHCLLCGQVGIAGSSRIGDRVVLAGQVGVADHITIGDDVVVGAKSGIGAKVPSGRIMMGFPALQSAQFMSINKAMRRLPRLADRVAALEKRVSSADPKA
ncbi:MAG: UDP-3-O-(3-hydroxymyristoyl)glucosamine N-acyltransferase [Pseudomonadota bacterium]